MALSSTLVSSIRCRSYCFFWMYHVVFSQFLGVCLYLWSLETWLRCAWVWFSLLFPDLGCVEIPQSVRCLHPFLPLRLFPSISAVVLEMLFPMYQTGCSQVLSMPRLCSLFFSSFFSVIRTGYFLFVYLAVHWLSDYLQYAGKPKWQIFNHVLFDYMISVWLIHILYFSPPRSYICSLIVYISSWISWTYLYEVLKSPYLLTVPFQCNGVGSCWLLFLSLNMSHILLLCMSSDLITHNINGCFGD